MCSVSFIKEKVNVMDRRLAVKHSSCRYENGVLSVPKGKNNVFSLRL